MTGIGIPGFQSFLDWGLYFRSEVKPFPVHACEPDVILQNVCIKSSEAEGQAVTYLL